MTTAIKVTAKPEIEYPDDDGELMSDNTLQFKEKHEDKYTPKIQKRKKN